MSSQKYEQLERIYHETQTNRHQELKQTNGDYVGWLSVDGLDIEYPVVQTMDNDFYLTHNFYKEEDRVGAIFMDMRSTSESLGKNTIIYGHNMKDNSMFGMLNAILQEDNPEDYMITYETEHGTYEWEIFSTYVTRETDWMQVDFDSSPSYIDFIAGMTEYSKLKFDKEVSKEDNIITLATCTSQISDERVVVHAKLVKGD